MIGMNACIVARPAARVGIESDILSHFHSEFTGAGVVLPERNAVWRYGEKTTNSVTDLDCGGQL